nr:hypothetical protein [uncultured Gemmiger sp.]
MFNLSMSYMDAQNFGAFLVFDGSIYLATIIALTLGDLDAAYGPMARNATIELHFDPETHHCTARGTVSHAPVNPAVPS